MSSSINLSPFDTNVTILYKYAEFYNIPSIHLIVREDNGGYLYLNSHDMIINNINSGVSLVDIYKKYNGLNSKINKELIIYLYYNLVVNVNKRSTEEALENVVKLDKDERVGESKFSTTEDLDRYYITVDKKYKRIKEEDAERLGNINNGLRYLAEDYRDYPFSGFDITGEIVNITPRWAHNLEMPKYDEGIDIFNQSEANIFVPFIRYTDSSGYNYYKILNGELDYETLHITGGVKAKETPNSFYLILWLGDDSISAKNKTGYSDLHDPTRLVNANSTSFYSVFYMIDDGVMDLNVPKHKRGNTISELEEATARLETSLKTLTIKEVNKVKIKGNFDIFPYQDGPHRYGVDIDETSFLHMILAYPFSDYVYVEERLKPFSYKQRLDVHWNEYYSRVGEQVMVHRNNGTKHPLSDNSIALTLQLIHNSTSVQMTQEVGNQKKPYVIPAGNRWVRFTIIGGADINDLRQCVLYFRSIFSAYEKYKDEILRNYYPGYTSDILAGINKRFRIREDNQDLRTSSHKVDELKKQLPEVFVDGYAYRCTGAYQPVLIPEEQVDDWKSQVFFHHGEAKNRQVLPFPKDNPKWYFGCPNDNIPYPGVKASYNLSNQDTYSHLPCCYKDDQTIEGAVTGYNEYYRGLTRPTKIKKLGAKYKVGRFAETGGIALIPKTLDYVLSNYREPEMYPGYPNQWNFVRYGVPDSPNSLLHCLLEAINDPGYNGTESYVLGVKKDIATKTSPYLLKQEMYDYTAQDIYNLLMEPNRYLDPDIFYRSLEEYFDVNIFVFEIGKQKDIVGEAIIKIPRHKNFHIRVIRNERPTVLIVNHYGASSKLSEIPKCELLVDYNEPTKSIVKAFGAFMTQMVYDLSIAADSNISWFPLYHKPTKVGEKAKQLMQFEDIYGQYDYASLLEGNGTLISQYVDSFGKARSYSFKYGEGKFISYVTMPGVPANINHYDDVAYTTIDVILENLPNATFTTKSVDKQGMVTGFWVQLFEIIEGIYIPIQPVPPNQLPARFANLPIGGDNPLQKKDNINHTSRYMKIVRDFNMIVSILEWLYEIERRSRSNVSWTNLSSKVLGFVDGYSGDSSVYYDFSKLPRRLPDVKDTQEALAYINSLRITPLVNTNSSTPINLHNRKFYKQIFDKMTDFEERTAGMDALVNKYIPNYYSNSNDFTRIRNNLIIMGDDVFTKWKDSKVVEKEEVFVINTKLNLSIMNPMEPRLYMDENKRIWLIQNTYSGDMLSALAVTINWFLHKKNTGPKTPPIDASSIPPHFVFSVGISGKLVAREDNTNGSDIYFNIIRYSGNYGALLPLDTIISSS